MDFSYFKVSIENGGMRSFNILVRAENEKNAKNVAEKYFKDGGFNENYFDTIEVKPFDIEKFNELDFDPYRVFDCDYIVEDSDELTMLDDLFTEGSLTQSPEI